MFLEDFFNPPKVTPAPQLLNSNRSFQKNLKPIINGVIDSDVVLIGLPYDINSVHNKGTAQGPDAIRSYLYNLLGEFKNLYISDLGNLKPVNTQTELQFIITELLEYLNTERIIPIFLGGSHDLTHVIADNLIDTKETIKLSIVDSCFDAAEKEDYTDHTFLSHLLNNKQITDLTLLGHQGYLSDASSVSGIPGSIIDLIPLAPIRKNISVVEPYLRDSDFLSIDMACVRHSDSPGNGYASPNGFYAEEICNLSRLAGFSDKISTFGIFGMNPTLDTQNISAQLAAQIIWFFIEGLDNRQKDYPLRAIETYQKKIVHQEDIDRNIVFYQNIQNGRWWFNASSDDDVKDIISCTYDDYVKAKNGEIPQRLMKHLR